MATTAQGSDDREFPDNMKVKEFMGHPMGLYILFFTELWERFSYYGMRAILVLFIISSVADGGLGWTNSEALALYGWYTMLVYVMSIPGGIIADKWWGQKKTVLIGGITLVIGHGVMAIPGQFPFFIALTLIVLGVGLLKPNISTMVGGLYREGDIRRDSGFTIFYIGINVGAFLAGIIVAYVAAEFGWHYGFGLAGIGMLLGQLVYMWGQKYLVGVGELDNTGGTPAEKELRNRPLNSVEKDRVKVLLISFLIVIVFWGAFEQAGGLLNIYAQGKSDRMLWGYEIPAGMFQSVNAFFIMIFGTAVAAFWAKRRLKGGEASSIYKMAIGTIIMGSGFILMIFASKQTQTSADGLSSMWWLVGAYLLHTIGELCLSPVALSFITKLAPVKYASIMMGVYFAMTGFGNKLAGSLGEAAQSEPIQGQIVASQQAMAAYVPAGMFEKGENHHLDGTIFLDGDEVQIVDTKTGNDMRGMFSLTDETKERLRETLREFEAGPDQKLHADIAIEPVKESEVRETAGFGYKGVITIEEVQNAAEERIFLIISIFTIVFGILLLMFIKPLKRLTHGAEDKEEDVQTKIGEITDASLRP